jgi:hypothetical protein
MEMLELREVLPHNDEVQELLVRDIERRDRRAVLGDLEANVRRASGLERLKPGKPLKCVARCSRHRRHLLPGRGCAGREGECDGEEKGVAEHGHRGEG